MPVWLRQAPLLVDMFKLYLAAPWKIWWTIWRKYVLPTGGGNTQKNISSPRGGPTDFWSRVSVKRSRISRELVGGRCAVKGFPFADNSCDPPLQASLRYTYLLFVACLFVGCCLLVVCCLLFVCCLLVVRCLFVACLMGQVFVIYIRLTRQHRKQMQP